MLKIDQLNDSEYEQLLFPVWEYLAITHPPEKSDVIFIFGGINLAVPQRAAELFSSNLAPKILISGNAGLLTKNSFKDPEALVFKNEILKRGVPEEVILLEKQATNTRENIIFGMQVLKKEHIVATRIILVATPFLMRRCLATFQRLYPSVTVFSCPPQGSILASSDRSRQDFAARLLAELERLKLYAKKGDIMRQPLPAPIKEAAERIQYFLEG